MENDSTLNSACVDVATKKSGKQRHDRQRRHKNAALIGSLKRFCERVLTGVAIVDRELGDTSSGSSFGSSSDDDESEKRKKGQSESSSCSRERQEAHGVRRENTPRAHNDRSMVRDLDRRIGNVTEDQNSVEYVDTLGYYDEDLAETIEDDIHVRSPTSTDSCVSPHKADGKRKIIIDFQNKNIDCDDDDFSIIEEVTSIETHFVRPGTACCFCAEPIARSPIRNPRSPKKKQNTDRPIIIRNNHASKNRKRVEVTSMLSEDDDKDVEEDEDRVQANTASVNDITGITVEDCEARFMEELESSQCEHYNLENSHWRKGFDFVRS